MKSPLVQEPLARPGGLSGGELASVSAEPVLEAPCLDGSSRSRVPWPERIHRVFPEGVRRRRPRLLLEVRLALSYISTGRRIQAKHPRPTPGCGSGHRLLHRTVGPSEWEPGNYPRPESKRPGLRHAPPPSPGRHSRPGRCPEAPAGRWTLQLRCTARGDTLPPRTTRPEGGGCDQCRRSAGARWRALRYVNPRIVGTAHLAVSDDAQYPQSTRHIR